MKIYVVIAIFKCDELGNVLVTTDKEKAFNVIPQNYEGCEYLCIETWENDKFIEDVEIH